MKRAKSQPSLKYFEDTDHEESVQSKGKARKDEYECERYNTNDVSEQLTSMTPHNREPIKRCEEFTLEKYGLWRHEQKNRAARLEKQLKGRWAMEELIEEQLNRFHAHYNRTMVPNKMKDVAQLLMPKWAPAHELATLSWLGDWRPSAILDLLRSLARSSSSFSCPSSDSVGIEGVLSQLANDIRIEEAVIDEEMAEIQATCILHLPFGPMNMKSNRIALAYVRSEFEKVHRVITKAQSLRLKALDLVVKKVLGQTDAAEFLVAFSGIQDLIHQFSTQYKLRKGPVSVPVKGPGGLAQ